MLMIMAMIVILTEAVAVAVIVIMLRFSAIFGFLRLHFDFLEVSTELIIQLVV